MTVTLDTFEHWVVVDLEPVGGLSPGDSIPIIGTFGTHDEAAEFIGTQPGHAAGRYGIDPPMGWDE